jgi:hypothetical protein
MFGVYPIGKLLEKYEKVLAPYFSLALYCFTPLGTLREGVGSITSKNSF